MLKKLHGECGVFDIYNVPEAARRCMAGYTHCSTRGQEGAGIAVSEDARLACRKGHGLLTGALSPDGLKKLPGYAGGACALWYRGRQ